VVAAAAGRAAAQCEIQKFTGSLDGAFDRFGQDLAVDDDGLIVGVSGGPRGGDEGRAYVFRLDENEWIEEAVLERASGAIGDRFGSAVEIEGRNAVVGAPGEDGGNGAVYVFERRPQGWVQLARLACPTDVPNHPEHFGQSVAMEDQTWVIVGASGDSTVATGAGAVYVFEKPASGWADTKVATAQLLAADGDADDGLGHAVTIDNDVIVAGAWRDEGPKGPDAGAVYLFVSGGAGWGSMTHAAKLTSSEGSEAWLGYSVSIDNDRILAGAPRTRGAGSFQGAAFYYEKPASGWADAGETLRFDTSDGAGARLGYDVAIDNQWILLGAPGSTALGTRGVADAWRFDLSSQSWVFQWKTNGSDSGLPSGNGDEFGHSVLIEERLGIVGAAGHDSGGLSDAGCCYSMVLDEPTAAFSAYGSGPLALSGAVLGPCDSDVALTTTGAPANALGATLLALASDTIGTPIDSYVLYVTPPWLVVWIGSFDSSGSATLAGRIPDDAPTFGSVWFQTLGFAPAKLYSNGLGMTVLP
jgi:hypothetical protein